MREYFEKRQLKGEIKLALPGRGDWIADKATLVNNIIQIVKNYQGMGYKLTLRQLYYQLVKANAIPNHDKVYSKLSGVVDDCRYSGNLDWAAIEDRGRVPKIPSAYKDIKDIAEVAMRAFRLDRQEGQPAHIELWTEKDAISNILYEVTSIYQVRLVINKGYTSSSAAYAAYERFVQCLNKGQQIRILYFGDHDPSGLDMVRDIAARMMLFLTQGERLKDRDCAFELALQKWWSDNSYTLYDLVDREQLTERHFKSLLSEDPSDAAVSAFEAARVEWYIEEHKLFQVVPIGLTMAQVQKYKLPPNPAKITDPRAAGYIRLHGQKSWEVDALEPPILTKLVKDAIEGLTDAKIYNGVLAKEKAEKAKLKTFLKIK